MIRNQITFIRVAAMIVCGAAMSASAIPTDADLPPAQPEKKAPQPAPQASEPAAPKPKPAEQKTAKKCEDVAAPAMSRSGDGPAQLPSASPVGCTNKEGKSVNLVPYFKNPKKDKEEFGWIPTDADKPEQTRKYMDHYTRAAHLYSRQNSPLSKDIPTRVTAGTGVTLPGKGAPAVGPEGPLRDAPRELEYVKGRPMPKGEDVRAIQKRLTDAGIKPGRVTGPNGRKGYCQDTHMSDGVMGPCTAEAIRTFQHHFGTIHGSGQENPMVADGRYTRQTHEALAGLSAEQLEAIRKAAGSPPGRPSPRPAPAPGPAPRPGPEPGPQPAPPVAPTPGGAIHDTSPETVSAWKRATGIAKPGIVEATLRAANTLNFKYPEMAFGILRQESTNATDNVDSTKGALGPYQIMPGTAAELAKWLRDNHGMDVRFNEDNAADRQRLRRDWNFNALLAVAHLKRTEAKFRIRELTERTASRFALSYHSGDGRSAPNGPVGRRYIRDVPRRVISLRGEMARLTQGAPDA